MILVLMGNCLQILLLKLTKNFLKFQISIEIIIKFVDFYLEKEYYNFLNQFLWYYFL